MKNVYIFSGLGADKRVFQDMDFSFCNATFVEWITPLVSENIENYATRIISQIKHESPILIGLSFGGMMAVEVAKLIETEKVILIASAKNQKEIPIYYRFAGKLKLHKLLPVKLLKMSNLFSFWFFGIENNEDKNVFRAVLKDTNENFLRWAIDVIVTWTNTAEVKNIVHIHGTEDRILPLRYVKSNIKVRSGGHFMTLNKAQELSEIVRIEVSA